MLPRFNINDLDGMGLAITERMKRLLSKFDIVVDTNSIIDGKKQNKESILANALNSLSSSGKVIEFMNALEIKDAEAIKEQNMEENLKNSKFLFILTRKLINSITEEAIKIFMKNEEMKTLQMELLDLIKREAEEKDSKLKNIYATQQAQLEERLREQLKIMHADALQRLNELQNESRRLDRQLEEIKLQRKAAIETHGKDLAQWLNNYTLPNGDKLFEGVPKEKQEEFSRKYIEIHHDTERKIDKINKKKELDIQVLKDEKNDIQQKINLKEIELKTQTHKSTTSTDSKVSGTLTTSYGISKVVKLDPEIRKLSQQVDAIDQQIKSIESDANKEIAKVKDEEITSIMQAARECGIDKLKDEDVAKQFIEDTSDNSILINAHEKLDDIDNAEDDVSELLKSVTKSRDLLADKVEQIANGSINMSFDDLDFEIEMDTEIEDISQARSKKI